jgi:transcriptional regulator with XRE-family HTH domain
MVPRHSSILRSSSLAERQDRPVQLLGRRVRRLRKDRRMSLPELATAVGIQAADLARLEKGEYRASLDVLFRILGVLQVSDDAFSAEMAKERNEGREGGAIREL